MCLSVAGCDLLDVVMTNDYLLFLTTGGIYVSNDMRNSTDVQGIRMSPLTYTKGFDPADLGCGPFQVLWNVLSIFCVPVHILVMWYLGKMASASTSLVHKP